MEFIALLSTGKGSWGQVAGLIKRGEWDKIILIGDDYAKKKFNIEKEVEFITIKTDRSIKEMISEIKDKIKSKINVK